MIILLYGPDDYRRIQKKNWFIAEFEKKHSSLGFGSFDMEGEGVADTFTEFTRNQSIFENAKLAVLENAFEMDAPKLAKLLKPLIEDKSTTVLLCESGKPVKALAFLLEKPSLSQKFDDLEGAAWGSFIDTEAKRFGLTLAPDATQFLGTVYQGNSWRQVRA